PEGLEADEGESSPQHQDEGAADDGQDDGEKAEAGGQHVLQEGQHGVHHPAGGGGRQGTHGGAPAVKAAGDDQPRGGGDGGVDVAEDVVLAGEQHGARDGGRQHADAVPEVVDRRNLVGDEVDRREHPQDDQ